MFSTVSSSRARASLDLILNLSSPNWIKNRRNGEGWSGAERVDSPLNERHPSLIGMEIKLTFVLQERAADRSL